MALTPGTTYTIVKPSFWRSRREVRDASSGLIGYFQLTGWAQTKAEGEAHGRRLIFDYTGWDGRNARMRDESGNLLATFEPVGWWGTQYKLTYQGKEYQWKLNGWGTTFTLFEGSTGVLDVTPGGYFKPGTITVLRTIDDKDALPLALFSLYEHYQVNSAAVGGAGAAGAAVVISTS